MPETFSEQWVIAFVIVAVLAFCFALYRRPKREREGIFTGDVSVDSGRLLIIDPAYIHSVSEAYCRRGEGPILTGGHQGLAVPVDGFGGDGIFAVTKKIGDLGLVESVTIHFRGPVEHTKVDRRHNGPPETRTSEQAFVDAGQGLKGMTRPTLTP